MEQNLIKKLDEVFSTYIRLRDSDRSGMGRCISCGSMYHWKQMDAGHFMGRANMATRFHEQNVHCQCRMCNRIKHGNIVSYEKSLRRKLGDETVDNLRILAHSIKHFSKDDISEMIAHYKSEVKRLEAEKW